jgi:hypothetical protein
VSYWLFKNNFTIIDCIFYDYIISVSVFIDFSITDGGFNNGIFMIAKFTMALYENTRLQVPWVLADEWFPWLDRVHAHQPHQHVL